MDALINIGGYDAQAITAIAEAVITVATCSGDPKVAVAALKALHELAPAEVRFDNCTISATELPDPTEDEIEDGLIEINEGDNR